jgi:uncharacterized membrane protein HdeD (DUF308 family)
MSAGTDMRSWTSVWWIPMVVGLLSVVAGVLAIVWPGETLLVIAIIAGVNIMLLSALLLGEAIADDEAQDRTLRVVLAVLGIIGGLVVLRRPGETLLVLILALGIWLVLDGILGLIGAIVGGPQRLLRALSGVIDIALGILILALPNLGLGTVAVLIGIGFIVRGAMLMVGGWALRGAAHDLTSAMGRSPAGAGGRSTPPAQPAA